LFDNRSYLLKVRFLVSLSSRSKVGILLSFIGIVAFAGGLVLNLAIRGPVAHAFNPDVLVTNGSPRSPFPQNKQNEPAIAVDANHSNILVAGSNDEIDLAPCVGNSCPFTPGVGVSGVYFSFDSGTTWTQPTYTGWSARTGTPGVGPIGTLPKYYESGLVSDGDPGLAFGPRLGTNGKFSWANGSRLYYSNLAENFPSTPTFKGFEAIAVSRTDDVASAAAGNASAWMNPVIVSRQSSTTFSDKEQIWADNASSSPFFGNVYLCWASFRSIGAAPAPLIVAVSHDGGNTWRQHQISAAANNSQRNPPDGCTVRTDSTGAAYVFGVGTVPSLGNASFELMSRSTNGGSTWSRPTPVAGPVTQPGIFDPVQGRPVIDGVAGARSDLAPAPSVDIANGSPTGTDATNRVVLTYVSGEITKPHVYFTESSNQGTTWSTPRTIEGAVDRGYYTAPAISPNGTDVYVVYNAFTTPYQTTTSTPRSLVGVVLHADVTSAGTGSFLEIHRGLPGDPRGSSANSLISEFLGDYVYAVATRTYGAAVWNDARNAADCPAIDAYRESLQTGGSVPKPAPGTACPATFGNSDIFGGSYPDPTP
jgi:hypothetical protein